MRLFYTIVLVLACEGAAAQPAVLVSPDTLFYPSESTVTITNVSGGGVPLDSVAVRIDGPRAYEFELVMPDSTYGPYYLNPLYETSFAVGAGLGPSEAAFIHVVGFDPCIICSGSGSGSGPDTLLVYSGGDATPATALIDLSTYVAAEPDPLTTKPFRLTAYPNPASGEITLRVEAAGTAGVDVAVYDVLGRVVERQRLAPGAAPEVTLRTGRLSPGTYHVVARTPEGSRAAQPFTVVR